MIYGSGVMQSLGGSVRNGTSGGGSGGRIALHTRSSNHFHGRLEAHGRGRYAIGGPGSVVIVDRLAGDRYSTRYAHTLLPVALVHFIYFITIYLPVIHNIFYFI